jgi:hypothetical protein
VWDTGVGAGEATVAEVIGAVHAREKWPLCCLRVRMISIEATKELDMLRLGGAPSPPPCMRRELAIVMVVLVRLRASAQRVSWASS